MRRVPGRVRGMMVPYPRHKVGKEEHRVDDNYHSPHQEQNHWQVPFGHRLPPPSYWTFGEAKACCVTRRVTVNRVVGTRELIVARTN